MSVRVATTDRFGRPVGEKEFWVEPRHEAELRRWLEYVRHNARRFLALVLGESVLALAGASLLAFWPSAYWLVVAALVALGVTTIVYPFATPETNALLGMRRARSLARAGGVLLLAMVVFLAIRMPA